jgi:membrane protein required for colicin V production
MAGITIANDAIKTSVVYPVVVKATPFALQVLGFFMPFAKYLLSALKGVF